MTYSLREAKKLLREGVCIDFIGYETDTRRIDSRINTEYHKDIENIIQDIMDGQHNGYKINRVYIYTNDNKDCLWIAKQIDKQWVAYNTVNTQQKIADGYSDIDYSTRYSDFAAYEYMENKTLYAVDTPDGTLQIRIRLDDECKNGFSEFAITADLYKHGVLEACGCLHDEIVQYAPQYKTIVDLHLSDIDGVPMYAVENGMYHMSKDITVGIEYLRLQHLDPEEANRGALIAKLKDKDMFYSRLVEVGAYKLRREQAEHAIRKLGYTKDGHKARAKKYKTVDILDNQDIVDAINAGERNAKAEAKQKIIDRYDAELAKSKKEHKIKIEMVEIDLNDNFIYYNHDNKLTLNWRNRGDKYPEDKIPQVQELCNGLGVKLEIK